MVEKKKGTTCLRSTKVAGNLSQAPTWPLFSGDYKNYATSSREVILVARQARKEKISHLSPSISVKPVHGIASNY